MFFIKKKILKGGVNFNNLKLLGVLKNVFFLYIWLLIVLMQAILICHGSVAFHVYKWYDEELHIAGLHYEQWLICVGLGFGSIIVGFLLKILPEAFCLQVPYI